MILEEGKKKPAKDMSEEEILAELDTLQRPQDAERMTELETALGGVGFVN